MVVAKVDQGDWCGIYWLSKSDALRVPRRVHALLEIATLLFQELLLFSFLPHAGHVAPLLTQLQLGLDRVLKATWLDAHSSSIVVVSVDMELQQLLLP